MSVRDVAKTMSEEFAAAVAAEEADDAAAILDIIKHMNSAYKEMEAGRAKVRALQIEAAEKYKQSLVMEDSVNRAYADRVAKLEENLRQYRWTKQHEVLAFQPEQHRIERALSKPETDVSDVSRGAVAPAAS